MAYSLQLYTGDGLQSTFTFSFDYLDQDHVKVNVDGVDTSFTFLSSNLISISPAPAVDSVIEIYRETPKARLVDFLNGSIQDAEDFDLNSDQLLYLILEGLDEFTKSLSRVPVDRDNKMYQDIDMNDYKITGLAEPTESTDAVRLVDIQNITGGTGTGWTPVDASETESGIIRIATSSEVTIGTDDTTAVTPAKLGDSISATRAYADAVSAAEATDAILSAGVYTDSQIVLANGYADSVSSQALSDANDYTDAQIAALPAASGLQIGDVLETHRTPGIGYLVLDNDSVSSTVYADLKAVAGFDKVADATSSYDDTGRTGYPTNVTAVASTTSYNVVRSNGDVWYESAANVWTQATYPTTFGIDGTIDVFTVDGDKIAHRSGTSGNVLVSTDGGVNWNEYSTGSGTGLLAVRYVNGILLAFNATATQEVYASADDGVTWDFISSVVPTTGYDNLCITNDGFVTVGNTSAVVYDVEVVSGNVYINAVKSIDFVNPGSANLLVAESNKDRNTIVAIFDTDELNIFDAIQIDIESGKKVEHVIAFDTTAYSLTVQNIQWIGGDTFAIASGRGVSFVDIPFAVGDTLFVDNVSTYVTVASSYPNLSANVAKGVVVAGRGATFDIFDINIDATQFYLPHNVSKNKYIKAL